MGKEKFRQVNIICTIGPACRYIKTLRSMAESGMNIVRLNCSHGTPEEHSFYISMVDALCQEGHDLKILLDLEGYQIRVGNLGNRRGLQLNEGMYLHLIRDTVSVRKNFAGKMFVPLDYEGSFKDIEPEVDIYIDDGEILLKCVDSQDDYIKAQVIVPGFLKNNKGVNIPEVELKFDVFTEKDKKDILFGISHKVDYIAQSFVRNKSDVSQVKNFLKENNCSCKVISKIENREGIQNIKEIIHISEGIMIARGDMGVSIPLYAVPMIQKEITFLCNSMNKMVITATQMLASMTSKSRPTRAEVTDVANAVLDGTNSVMLSAETAVGLHPVGAVKMMKSVIDHTQRQQKSLEEFRASLELGSPKKGSNES